MIIVFFIFFELAALPGLAIWSIESLPIRIRTVLVTALLFILCLTVINKFLKKLGMNYSDIGVRLPKNADLKKSVFLFLSGTVVCLIWAFIYFRAFEMILPTQYNRLSALKDTGYVQFLFEWGRSGEFCGTAVLWISTLFIATTEELAFRGLIFNYLKREYSFKDALIWNTVLFTLAHLNPYNFPVSFVLGLVFTLLYVKSGGLAVPISVHFAYNLSVFYLDKFV